MALKYYANLLIRYKSDGENKIEIKLFMFVKNIQGMFFLTAARTSPDRLIDGDGSSLIGRYLIFLSRDLPFATMNISK